MSTLTEQAVSQGYSYNVIQALAVCETSGLAGVKRVERAITSYRMSDLHKVTEDYTQALTIYARSINIEVHGSPNTSYDGWYHLADAIWQRMSPAQQKDAYQPGYAK